MKKIVSIEVDQELFDRIEVARKYVEVTRNKFVRTLLVEKLTDFEAEIEKEKQTAELIRKQHQKRFDSAIAVTPVVSVTGDSAIAP